METPSKELRRFLNCCNILPLTIGANIGVDQSKWIIVMQAAFFVTSLWACFNGIYGVSYIPLTNNFYDKQNIIPTIAVFAWVMGVFGTIILLMTRRKKIISMAGSLYEHISFGDKKSMIRRAIALPILALIFDTVLAISISLKDVKETHNNSKQTFVLQVTLLVAKSAADSLSSNFIVKGCVVYFIFYRLLSVYISHTLETIRTHLQSLRDRSTNLLVVHEILSESLGFMIEFDDMFSLLPFLWISNNFFYTTSTVYRMVKGNNKGFVIEQLVVDKLVSSFVGVVHVKTKGEA